MSFSQQRKLREKEIDDLLSEIARNTSNIRRGNKIINQMTKKDFLNESQSDSVFVKKKEPSPRRPSPRRPRLPGGSIHNPIVLDDSKMIKVNFMEGKENSERDYYRDESEYFGKTLGLEQQEISKICLGLKQGVDFLDPKNYVDGQLLQITKPSSVSSVRLLTGKIKSNKFIKKISGNITTDGISVIIKELIYENYRKIERDLKYFIMEVQIYSDFINPLIKHKITPHVIPLIGYSFESSKSSRNVMLLKNIQPQINGLNRYADILKSKSLTLTFILNNFLNKKIFFQLVYTLAAFEQVGIQHNDLHLNNIMIETLEKEISYVGYIISSKIMVFVRNVKFLPRIYDYDRSSVFGKHSSKKKTNILNDMFDTYKVRKPFADFFSIVMLLYRSILILKNNNISSNIFGMIDMLDVMLYRFGMFEVKFPDPKKYYANIQFNDGKNKKIKRPHDPYIKHPNFVKYINKDFTPMSFLKNNFKNHLTKADDSSLIFKDNMSPDDVQMWSYMPNVYHLSDAINEKKKEFINFENDQSRLKELGRLERKYKI